jgi:predicted peroxiredoxin
MSDQKQTMAIVASHGHENERSMVAWTIATGAQNAGMEVTMFLVASAVDIVRKGAIEHARPNPCDPPLKELVHGFLDRGGRILCCPPCAKVRGYEQDDLIDGVEVIGSAALHALIKDGAHTLCF